MTWRVDLEIVDPQACLDANHQEERDREEPGRRNGVGRCEGKAHKWYPAPEAGSSGPASGERHSDNQGRGSEPSLQVVIFVWNLW